MLCPIPDDQGLHEPLVVPNFLARLEATKWMLVRVLHLARLRRWASSRGEDGLWWVAALGRVGGDLGLRSSKIPLHRR